MKLLNALLLFWVTTIKLVSSLGGLVFLVLLILKLTGEITISWFFVFLPLFFWPFLGFGVLALVGGCLLIVLFILGVLDGISWFFNRVFKGKTVNL